MKRKIISLILLATVLVLLLTACDAAPVKDVYLAAGDGTQPESLTKTTTFTGDDDLNVVVTLNVHKRELPVYAVFIAPDGTSYPTDTLEADETVGVLLLGLDWEAQPEAAQWPEGAWTAEIYVDGTREKTATFTVQAVIEEAITEETG